MFLILAQEAGAKPEEVAGLAERLNKGGVPVIALFFALMFAVAAIVLFKMLLGKSDKFTDLERNYRGTIEEKAKQDKTDAENRLKEAKSEADKKEGEKMTLMRERFTAEKERDADFAHAIRVIEDNTKFTEKVDKKMDQVDDLKRLVSEMNDRLRRLEERRT